MVIALTLGSKKWSDSAIVPNQIEFESIWTELSSPPFHQPSKIILSPVPVFAKKQNNNIKKIKNNPKSDALEITKRNHVESEYINAVELPSSDDTIYSKSDASYKVVQEHTVTYQPRPYLPWR